MQVITQLDRRIGYVYDLETTVTFQQAKGWFDAGKWGITDKMQGNMLLLEDFMMLNTFLALLEWKTWEQNTFYLTYGEDGCPKWNYPSTVVDKKLMDCIVKHFHCHCIDIRTILRKFGVMPYGVKPDGIDYMHIQQGFLPCDGRLFQVGKPYGTDFI